MPLAPNVSKYLPPVLPRIVSRTRLLERMAPRPGLRLVLVVAQAAQGKSTLVADHLSRSGVPGAWLHLDTGDSDPINLYYLLVHSLQQARPDLDLSAWFENPPTLPGPGGDPNRCRERLRDLAVRLGGPMEIVLDGIDRLGPATASLRLVEDLLTGLPPGVRMLATAREMPDLRLQALKMRREVRLLSNVDLAFDRREIATLFDRHLDLTLSDKECRRLHDMTGGWVGGLVLLAESLRRLAPAERRPRLTDGTPELLRGEALQYFSEEVFSAQPEEVRDFLVRTALLEVIDPGVAAGLTAAGDAEGFLRDLEQRNLFIHSVRHRGQGRLYRYNELFRDFLQGIFRRTIPPEDQAALHRRAGDLLWENRSMQAAIRHYLAAGAWDRAAAGLKKIGIDLYIRGRRADLAAWVAALPDSVVAGDRWLDFLRLLAGRMGSERTLKKLRRSVERFRAAGDARGHLLALAHCIETAVFRGHDPVELRSWLAEGEELLRRLSDRPWYTYAKAALWLQLGFGRITGGGRLSDGLSACRNAWLLARRMENESLQVNATVINVLGLAAAGEFGEADRCLARIARRGGGAYAEYRALQNMVNVDLALNRGRLDDASRHLDVAREDIETFGLLFLYPSFIDSSGRLQLYRGDYTAADGVARHLAEVAVLSNNPRIEGLSLRLQALICYHRGRFRQAWPLVRRAVELLKPAGDSDLHLLRARLLQGLIRLHRGKPAAALRDLEVVLARFDRAASHLSVSETHLTLALVRDAGNDPGAARRHLAAGFRIAAEKHFTHFIVMRRGDIQRACRLAVDSGPAAAAAYATRLMTETPGPTATAASAAAAEPLREAHRGRSRTQLPRLDIRTLGGFRVLRGGTSPIADREWAGNRPRLLLKAILVHGARDVPRDVLTEALWPESRPPSAERNFKVTLHRLRKILEPRLDPRRGSGYVHLKDHRVSLDRDLCRIDVERFLEGCKRIRRSAPTAGDDELLEMCREAAECYEGDFLPEEPYAPWVEMKRSLLRDDYVAVEERRIEILRRAGRLTEAGACCRKLAHTMPSLERVQRLLMELYAAQGMRAAALQVYADLRATLATDLGVEPDAATEAVYRKIRQTSGQPPL